MPMFKQKQTNHCTGLIIGQFLSSTFFLICLESAKCNKTFQSKRTKEAKGPSHEVMALKSPAQLYKKSTSRQSRHRDPSLRNLFGFTLQLQPLAFKRFLRKQENVCMTTRGLKFAYLRIQCFRHRPIVSITRTQEMLKSEKSLISESIIFLGN